MFWLFGYSVLWYISVVFLLIVFFWVVRSKINKVMPKNEQEKMEKNEYVLQLIEKKTSLIRKIKWYVVSLFTGYILFELCRSCGHSGLRGLVVYVFGGTFLLFGGTVVGGRLVCNLYNFIYYAIKSLREKKLSYLFVYSSLFKMSGKGFFICLVLLGVIQVLIQYIGMFVALLLGNVCKMF